MDKKTILGIVVVAALFLGFAYFNTKQQEKYQQEMAAYQAYQDSVAAATRPVVPVVPVADSTAVAASDTAAPEAAADAPMPYAGSRSLRWANTSPVRVTRRRRSLPSRTM